MEGNDTRNTSSKHGLHALFHRHEHSHSHSHTTADTSAGVGQGVTRHNGHEEHEDVVSSHATIEGTSTFVNATGQSSSRQQQRQTEKQGVPTASAPQSTAVRRLVQEFRTLKAHPISYVRAEPSSSNLFYWDAWIQGAPDTPYYGGTFHLSMVFPSDYPFRPPAVKFETRVYHPNISINGAICVDLLKQGVWSPALSIQALLLALLSLLATPNPDDPLRPDAAILLKTDVDKYNAKVRSYIRKYARSPQKCRDSSVTRVEGK